MFSALASKSNIKAHTEDGDCDISSPKIESAYLELVNNKEMSWMLLTYTTTNGCTLDVAHTGNDLDALVPHMKEDLVHFAIIKITAGNSTYGTMEKYILVTWVGKRVAPTKRSKASRHKRTVSSIIKEGAALEVHTSSVEDVKEGNLLQKLYTARSNSRAVSTPPPKPHPATGSPSGNSNHHNHHHTQQVVQQPQTPSSPRTQQPQHPTKPPPQPYQPVKPKPTPTISNTKPSPTGFRRVPDTTPPSQQGGLQVPNQPRPAPGEDHVKEMGRLGRKLGVSPHPVRRAEPPPSPSEPRHTTKPPNKVLSFGIGSLQGKRPTMEDRHVALLSLPKNPKIAFFGVYDGHQGDEASEFAKESFHLEVDKCLSQVDTKFGGDRQKALIQACISLDENFCDEAASNYWDSGTTVIAALFDAETKKILALNLGDSRCVFGRGGKAIPLSEDHKPWVEKEKERILAAGKYIEDNRINGSHAFSRSIGDREMKDDLLEPQDQAISPIPEFKEVEMCKDPTEREFLILACDGLWDVMSNADAVHWVESKLEEESDLDAIAVQLAQHAIDIGSTDNVSVLIVNLPK